MSNQENKTNSVLQPLSQQGWEESANIVVSVFVAAYNQEHYIGQCLDSILRQVTDFPVEIIIRDDASTDSTAGIIRQYQKKYPHIVKPRYETENQFSKNNKFRPVFHEQAKGEFVAGCDGDDYWLDHFKLVKQVAFLRENPEYVLSFHDAVYTDSDGKPSVKGVLNSKLRVDFPQPRLRTMENSPGYLLIGTVMYRNVLTDFPPEFYLAPNGDNFLPILLGAFGAAKFQPEIKPLAYRAHEQSMFLSKPKTEKLRMQLQSMLQITAYFTRIGEAELASKILMDKTIPYLVRYFRATGNLPNKPFSVSID